MMIDVKCKVNNLNVTEKISVIKRVKIKRESFIPALYNDYFKIQICMQLFEDELNNEYLTFVNSITKSLN